MESRTKGRYDVKGAHGICKKNGEVLEFEEVIDTRCDEEISKEISR